MKKFIFIFAAAICCSCTIMDGGRSGRDRQSLMRYGQNMFNVCIMTPAAIAERLLENQETEIEGIQYLFGCEISHDRISENEWDIHISLGKGEFTANVTHVGKDEGENNMFRISVEGSDKAKFESGGRMTEVEAAFEFPDGQVIITNPRHPLVFDDLRDYWKRVTGEGKVILVIYRNDVWTDKVSFTLGKDGSDVACTLDDVYLE